MRPQNGIALHYNFSLGQSCGGLICEGLFYIHWYFMQVYIPITLVGRKSQFIKLPKFLKTKTSQNNLNVTVKLSDYFGVKLDVKQEKHDESGGETASN